MVHFELEDDDGGGGGDKVKCYYDNKPCIKFTKEEEHNVWSTQKEFENIRKENKLLAVSVQKSKDPKCRLYLQTFMKVYDMYAMMKVTAGGNNNKDNNNNNNDNNDNKNNNSNKALTTASALCDNDNDDRDNIQSNIDIKSIHDVSNDNNTIMLLLKQYYHFYHVHQYGV